MSTSDQQGPLTRKQLREIRLTGSTPVISPEEAAAAASEASENAPETTAEQVAPAPVAPAQPETPPESTTPSGSAPLTRRQVRERERLSTASVPVAEPADDRQDAAPDDAPSVDSPAEAPSWAPEQTPSLVTGVPAFSPSAAPAAADADEDDTDDEQQGAVAPVSASTSAATTGDVPLSPETGSDEDAVAAVASLGIEVEESDEQDADDDDVLADVGDADDSDIESDERPTVSSAFGRAVITDAETPKPFSPSFDELLTVGDSTGSHHRSPNTLIFNPAPGDGSLSGPVASTGEILVTGSYELPKGLGSQGHAHGTTDGKDVDAVLIDGELPPASSPTPIAASSAVSTIKPAGEVIRPPAPEKGNRLMLILAIVAGGLALAVGVAVVIAFTTNVF